MTIHDSFFLSVVVLFSLPLKAQQNAVYANGSLGINRNYVSGGIRHYIHKDAFLSLEFGGGLLGQQSESVKPGSSPDVTGQNSYSSSISSSIVIAPDGNAPTNAYPAMLQTRFTGGFIRAAYDWRFPSHRDSVSEVPRGFRLGFELAWFSIIQRQDVQLLMVNSKDTYDYHGTAHANALAPGFRLGYDFVIHHKLLISPEIATPFYIPAGKHAKTNGPFGKESVELRLAIGWLINNPSREKN
ncbi:MAG TPA: hypothetical protein VGO45_12605 [Bacteroidia bacterium]|jgi:hypothetical protein|nr:hypothetical protein [Bacteroidia bacterium]